MAAPTFWNSVPSAPYSLSYTVVDGTGTTFVPGLGDIEINWQRPVYFHKSLDKATIGLVYGRLEGDIKVQGFKGVTAPTSTAMALNAINTLVTTAVSVKVRCAASTTPVYAAGTEQTYTGVAAGPGFATRQISQRFWTLDATANFALIS